jgi:hypothetical protein
METITVWYCIKSNIIGGMSLKFWLTAEKSMFCRSINLYSMSMYTCKNITKTQQELQWGLSYCFITFSVTFVIQCSKITYATERKRNHLNYFFCSIECTQKSNLWAKLLSDTYFYFDIRILESSASTHSYFSLTK